MEAHAPAVRIDRQPPQDTMAEDLRSGLAREPKEIPPKYFYDARGSELFDRITTLPEYYPTRCERAILNRHAPHIVEASGARELVELGSGTASKTRALLYAMAGAGQLERYVPFDVDESMVERCAEELVELYPGLHVHGVVGDFNVHLERIPEGERRLIAFLGGTIGNLHPSARSAFLSRLGRQMDAEDRLLIGFCLPGDPVLLEAAYNDSEGVTAEFNRNALRVLNAGLDGNFDPAAFQHEAFFDQELSRIEMWLRPATEQQVSLPGAGLDLTLAAGEGIRTEISTKFTAEAMERELAAAGLRPHEVLTDPDGLFGLAIAGADAGTTGGARQT